MGTEPPLHDLGCWGVGVPLSPHDLAVTSGGMKSIATSDPLRPDYRQNSVFHPRNVAEADMGVGVSNGRWSQPIDATPRRSEASRVGLLLAGNTALRRLSRWPAWDFERRYEALACYETVVHLLAAR